MAKVKLAEALLRRKELDAKVKLTTQIRMSDLFDVKVTRIKAQDGVDDVTAKVPKLLLAQVTAESDHYSKCLRHVDAAIQQANWTTEIEVPDFSMADYQQVKKD